MEGTNRFTPAQRQRIRKMAERYDALGELVAEAADQLRDPPDEDTFQDMVREMSRIRGLINDYLRDMPLLAEVM